MKQMFKSNISTDWGLTPTRLIIFSRLMLTKPLRRTRTQDVTKIIYQPFILKELTLIHNFMGIMHISIDTLVTFILTKFSVSYAHVALQEVVHFLYSLLLKFCWLQNTNTSVSIIYLLRFYCIWLLQCSGTTLPRMLQIRGLFDRNVLFKTPLMRGTECKWRLVSNKSSLHNSVSSSTSTATTLWECASSTDTSGRII